MSPTKAPTPPTKKSSSTTPTMKNTSPKPASASDAARAEALKRLTTSPATPTKPPKGRKPARGSKPEGWQDDPLESDAALDAALADTNAHTTSPTNAHTAKSAKGRGKTAATAKGSPTGGRRANGAKAGKVAKPARRGPKRLSALDAAAKILAESDRPLRAKDLIEVMHAKGLWTSPGGKTPEATLYAAIIREIATKGTEARFHKVDRGMFQAAGKPG